MAVIFPPLLQMTKDKDAKEILNYQNALSCAETLAQEKKLPSIRDFCDLQKLVTEDLIQKDQHVSMGRPDFRFEIFTVFFCVNFAIFSITYKVIVNYN